MNAEKGEGRVEVFLMAALGSVAAVGVRRRHAPRYYKKNIDEAEGFGRPRRSPSPRRRAGSAAGQRPERGSFFLGACRRPNAEGPWVDARGSGIAKGLDDAAPFWAHNRSGSFRIGGQAALGARRRHAPRWQGRARSRATAARIESMTLSGRWPIRSNRMPSTPKSSTQCTFFKKNSRSTPI